MYWLLIGVAAIVIVGLGIYAGQLLSKLNAQKQKQLNARQRRIGNINESIQTIAFAMKQQQCNLSEGAIRIFKILESVPIVPLPDYEAQYPMLYSLYQHVQDLPTHEARSKLAKAERREQDRSREEKESELKSKILPELEALRKFEAK